MSDLKIIFLCLVGMCFFICIGFIITIIEIYRCHRIIHDLRADTLYLWEKQIAIDNNINDHMEVQSKINEYLLK